MGSKDCKKKKLNGFIAYVSHACDCLFKWIQSMERKLVAHQGFSLKFYLLNWTSILVSLILTIGVLD